MDNTKNFFWKSLIVGIFVLLGLVAYKILFSPLSAEDCLKLESNFRTSYCLQMLSEASPTPQPNFVDVSLLQITKHSMSPNFYYEPNPTFTATIVNNSGQAVTDLVIQFKFFKNKISSCLETSADDTQYVQFSDAILPGDSQIIKSFIKTNFDTSGPYNYCADIISAKEL